LATTKLTHEQLIQQLEYIPELGRFKRLQRRSNQVVGTIAGADDCTKGYRKIMVLGKMYKEHHLVWFYLKKSWPLLQIDHIDGNKANNKIENLREVNQTQNMYNKHKAHANNASGFLGVCKVKDKYYPRLKVGNKLLHLGTFSSGEEAHKRYLEEKAKYLE